MQGSESVGRITGWLACGAALALMVPVCAQAQVFVVQAEPVSQHYAHFQPTKVPLPAGPMTTIGREQLIRFLQSEQGFAMRPLPVAVLTLHANGGMEPTGDKYIGELQNKGVAAKPGQRVQITNIQIKGNRIILDLNNGPYHRHRFLRHISIGMDPYEDENPMMLDPAPTGSRIVLVFPSGLPDLTGEQVEQLLKPMIDFGVKSPAEAYAETLPDFLRKAILDHRVLVGMDRQMVLYAKGEPDQKDREQKDGKPFVIWIYGQAPEPVEFVRFDGSLVAQVEVAKVGEPIAVQSENQMGDFWGKQPPAAENVHTVTLGDRSAQDAAEENVPAAPPTLRNPGEKLPDSTGTQVMKPVKFPPGMQRPGDPGYTPPPTPAPNTTAPPASANEKQGTGQQPSTAAKNGQTAPVGTDTTASEPSKKPTTTTPTEPPQQFVSAQTAEPPR
jgi:hypothetical protein